MIEIDIKRFLEDKITDVPVFVGEKPKDKPIEYVVIQTIAGYRQNEIDSITLNFESYSDSMLKTAQLNERVKSAMLDSIELNNISSARYSGGGQNIDTATKTYCYESVFNFYYYN